MGRRAVPDVLEKINNSCRSWNSYPGSFVPWPSHCTDYGLPVYIERGLIPGRDRDLYNFHAVYDLKRPLMQCLLRVNPWEREAVYERLM